MYHVIMIRFYSYCEQISLLINDLRAKRHCLIICVLANSKNGTSFELIGLIFRFLICYYIAFPYEYLHLVSSCRLVNPPNFFFPFLSFFILVRSH